MAVMAREAWTDGRLDDLNVRVGEVKSEVGKLRSEMKEEIGDLRSELKGDIKELRSETKAEFRDLRNAMDARFDSLQKTMVLGVVGMSASIVGALLAIQL
jgi:archaellum component FlaC